MSPECSGYRHDSKGMCHCPWSTCSTPSSLLVGKLHLSRNWPCDQSGFSRSGFTLRACVLKQSERTPNQSEHTLNQSEHTLEQSERTLERSGMHDGSVWHRSAATGRPWVLAGPSATWLQRHHWRGTGAGMKEGSGTRRKAGTFVEQRLAVEQGPGVEHGRQAAADLPTGTAPMA